MGLRRAYDLNTRNVRYGTQNTKWHKDCQDDSESVMSGARYATVMVIYDVPPPPMVPAKLAGELFRGLATNVE